VDDLARGDIIRVEAMRPLDDRCMASRLGAYDHPFTAVLHTDGATEESVLGGSV